MFTYLHTKVRITNLSSEFHALKSEVLMTRSKFEVIKYTNSNNQRKVTLEILGHLLHLVISNQKSFSQCILFILNNKIFFCASKGLLSKYYSKTVNIDVFAYMYIIIINQNVKLQYVIEF